VSLGGEHARNLGLTARWSVGIARSRPIGSPPLTPPPSPAAIGRRFALRLEMGDFVD